jgi:histidinol-phosphate aminotransferase
VRRLLRYYRQFEGLSEREVNERLRDEATERRAREVARIEPLDLSRTTWPEYPPPAVVNAITYAARRGLHRYLDPHAATLRAELAHHLGVEAEQVVVGGGIAQLMGAAAQALLEPEDELVTPWPSYPLYPVIARRSRGHAVPVPGFGGPLGDAARVRLTVPASRDTADRAQRALETAAARQASGA